MQVYYFDKKKKLYVLPFHMGPKLFVLKKRIGLYIYKRIYMYYMLNII